MPNEPRSLEQICASAAWAQFHRMPSSNAGDIAHHVAKAVREALGDGHYVDFAPLRWTVEHSIDCRLSGRMSECDVHTGIVAWIEDRDVEYDAFKGRWLIRGFDASGTPALDRAAGGE